mmetsp:Transcript_15512/g.15482  ORF Transcript_15512/g.15482 Transcript_15512/m.15482 type:complete len:82 (+) Transcript_15512:627-872(+)
MQNAYADGGLYTVRKIIIVYALKKGITIIMADVIVGRTVTAKAMMYANHVRHHFYFKTIIVLVILMQFNHEIIVFARMAII